MAVIKNIFYVAFCFIFSLGCISMTGVHMSNTKMKISSGSVGLSSGNDQPKRDTNNALQTQTNATTTTNVLNSTSETKHMTVNETCVTETTYPPNSTLKTNFTTGHEINITETTNQLNSASETINRRGNETSVIETTSPYTSTSETKNTTENETKVTETTSPYTSTSETKNTTENETKVTETTDPVTTTSESSNTEGNVTEKNNQQNSLSLPSYNTAEINTTFTPTAEPKLLTHLSTYVTQTSFISTTTERLPRTKNVSSGVMVKINIVFKVNGTFDESNLTTQFQSFYKGVPGFIGVRVVFNSVKRRRKRENTKHDTLILILAIAPFRNITKNGTDYLNKTYMVLEEATNKTLCNLKLADNTTFIDTNNTLLTLRKDIQDLKDKMDDLVCGIAYTLKISPSVVCESKCKIHDCNKHGVCDIDFTGKPICNCDRNEKTVYFGTTCEYESEILELESKYIIAIACGIGGAVIVALILSIVWLLSKRTSTKEIDKEYKITDHDTLSYNHPMGLLSRQRTNPNMYFGTTDTYYVDNRRYTVVEGGRNRGNTYLYSPSTIPDNDDTSEKSYNNNKSYCSEEYAIKRPRVTPLADPIYCENRIRANIMQPDYM